MGRPKTHKWTRDRAKKATLDRGRYQRECDILRALGPVSEAEVARGLDALREANVEADAIRNRIARSSRADAAVLELELREILGRVARHRRELGIDFFLDGGS